MVPLGSAMSGLRSSFERLPREPLLDIASFLPAAEQFGRLRSLSRDLRRRLPALPTPEPIYLILFSTEEGARSHKYTLGVFHLSKIAAVLREIASGKVKLRVYNNYLRNRLLFFRMDLDELTGRGLWFGPGTGHDSSEPPEFTTNTSNVDVGLEDVDPARRKQLHMDRPRIFRDLIAGLGDDEQTIVSVDRVLFALYKSNEAHEESLRVAAQFQLSSSSSSSQE